MTTAILAPAPFNDGDWPPCPPWCVASHGDEEAEEFTLGRTHERVLTSIATRAHELAESVTVRLDMERFDDRGLSEGETRVVLRLGDEADSRLTRVQCFELAIALLQVHCLFRTPESEPSP